MLYGPWTASVACRRAGGWSILSPTLILHLLGYGFNWSVSMQMSPILHFQAVLQIDLTWPLTFVTFHPMNMWKFLHYINEPS